MLGRYDDPNLPVRDVDLAFFHDVLHHIEDRAGYIQALAKYIKPTGRVAIIELDANEPGGSHGGDPEILIHKAEVAHWLAGAGFRPAEEFPL